MLIKNLSALLGTGLDFALNTDMLVCGGIFEKIRPNQEPAGDVIDGEGLLAIPGFVNAHTHIGDSVGKDITLDSTVDKRIHPVFGAKSKILRHTADESLKAFMKNSCHMMLKKGITTFADFREGGPDGVALLQDALDGVPIRSVILGRVEHYGTESDIQKNAPFPKGMRTVLSEVIQNCDGIGVSGANENSDSVLQHYSGTGKLRAIHCSETQQSVARSMMLASKSETVRALMMNPHFLVHMTFASRDDLRLAAKKTGGIVVCPRANASLAEGIPDIRMMQDAGCMVALGTDNVMINSPDMFREMDYLWKATMATSKARVDPREILKMATVNGAKILGTNAGVIEAGRAADCFFIDKHAIDLEPMHDPHAAVVHRASESCIRAVMVGGRLVHGKL